jgi:hypothetical protein
MAQKKKNLNKSYINRFMLGKNILNKYEKNNKRELFQIEKKS